MGVAAFIFGLICLLICILLFWIPLFSWIGIIPGVLGIVFGAVGIAKASRNNGRGRGLAIAGLVLSIIGILIVII